MKEPDHELIEALIGSDEELMPVVYQHGVAIYNVMLDEAKQVREGFVWQGKMTFVFEKLGISAGYYTPVMNKLKEMGCVKQIQRGGGGSPSIWEVNQPPTPALYKSFLRDSGSGKAYAVNTKQRELEQTQGLLADKVNVHQRSLEQLLYRITRLESRCNSLERRIEELEPTTEEEE